MPSIVTCTASSSALPLHPGCDTATVTFAASQDLRQKNWGSSIFLSVSTAYSRVVDACGRCSCAGRVAPSDACLSEQCSVRLRGAEPASFPKRCNYPYALPNVQRENTTTARILLFGINAVYRTHTSARDAVRLASTQEQRPLPLRRHGDTVASTVDMAKPNSRARYMPQHLSSRRAAPYRAHW
jgi:hypothetical protein